MSSSPAWTRIRPPPRSGLAPGMVIAEVQQQPVANATELQQRVDKLKKDGTKGGRSVGGDARWRPKFLSP